MNGTIVVSGAMAQRPGIGGHTWVFLQYLLGFRRLGYDVLFIDWIDSDAGTNAAGRESPPEASINARYLIDVMEGFNLHYNFALLSESGRSICGLSRSQVLERVRDSEMLINVMGFLRDEEILAAAPLRVFLDIDPGFDQMWRELELHNPFIGFDRFVTIGENIGKHDCGIPTCGLTWITSPQPIVLDLWPVSQTRTGGPFTSIATWRGAFGPLEYEGKTYGLRVHEFRKFMELPTRTTQNFELALDIDPVENRDISLLKANNWRLVDPRTVAGDPWHYRRHIQSSMAELMVAKTMYVETRGGWFSDRSICYLASGRPVLAQDTGLQGLYPTGEGLVTFSSLDEAVHGAEEIARNLDHHSRAARQLAEEHFDSDQVLTRLLQQLGVA